MKREFFQRPTEIVAKELIGKILNYNIQGKILSGKIVETEAYLHKYDEACHAAKGKTSRNSPMFGSPGNIYVYRIYGTHYCINFSTFKKGLGCAVLLRALEPISGIDKMLENRRRANPKISKKDELCSGPGKICSAFGFNLNHNNQNLFEEEIWIEESGGNPLIKATDRIGISKAKNLKLRFIDLNSKYLSK